MDKCRRRLFQSDEPLPPIMQRAMVAGKQQPNGEHQYIQQTHASADGGVDLLLMLPGIFKMEVGELSCPILNSKAGPRRINSEQWLWSGTIELDLAVAAWTLVDLLCMEA